MEKRSIIIKQQCDIFEALNKEGVSYNLACKLLRNKDVRVNGVRTRDNFVLTEGDEVLFFLDEPVLSFDAKLRENIKYEDQNVIIISKPSGIEVEGKDSLAQKLHAFAVHRLDRNTSGLIVLAKNEESKKALMDAIKNKHITKKYYAEVVGKSSFKNFTHKAYLVKNAKESLVKIYDKPVKGSSEIVTIFNTIKSNSSSSIVECTLVTGKTHQIRASLSYLGYPIIGDGKYGKNEDNKKFKKKHQQLHSFCLSFKNLSFPLEYLNGKTFIDKPDWAKF